MAFALNIFHVFLTYPQVPEELQRDALHNYLTNKFAFEYCCTSEERHEDGGKHFHVYAKFTKRFRSKDQSIFDYSGRHPNIQSAYNPGKCLTYVQKDKNFIESGVPPALKEDNSWDAIVAVETKDDFMQAVKAKYPRDYVLNLEKLEYYAEKRFKPELPAYVPIYNDFIVPAPVKEWMDQMHQVRVPTAHIFSLGLDSAALS